MIPPGLHYVYCASQNQQFNECAPRVGFLHFFKANEILIREWNRETEELQIRVKGDAETEKQCIRDNLESLDK